MTKVDDFNKFDFFNAFSKDQLANLGKVTETKTFKKGSEIYKEGDRANHIFLVTKGWVSLRKIDPEKDIGISFENRGRGELFGTACFMKPQEYTLTAICMEDSEVLVMDADKLPEVETFAGNRRRVAMGKMPPVGQFHGKNSVADIKHCKIYGKIGGNPAVGLHIGMVGTEKTLCS